MEMGRYKKSDSDREAMGHSSVSYFGGNLCSAPDCVIRARISLAKFQCIFGAKGLHTFFNSQALTES